MFEDDDLSRTAYNVSLRGADRLRAIAVIDDRATTHALPESGDVPIGRMGRTGLMLEHTTISRMHAVLHLGPPLTIEDLGSVNGTFVREIRVQPGKPVRIEHGDLVRVGDVYLIVTVAK